MRDEDGKTRLVDRHQGGQRVDPDSGAPTEDDRGNDAIPIGAGPELNAQWRSAVGLHERVMVPLDQVPGGSDLVRSLGLDADEVEAYVSPNIVGCLDELERCADDDDDAARAIAHLATGFPLFAEERYDGGPAGVWVTAESSPTATQPPIPPRPIPIPPSEPPGRNEQRGPSTT